MGNKGTASYLDIRISTIYTNKGPVLYPLETGLYHHNDGESSKHCTGGDFWILFMMIMNDNDDEGCWL